MLRLEVGDHLLAFLSPQRPRRREMLFGVRNRRASEARHAVRLASSTASCSGVASPSASAPTYMSSRQGREVDGSGGRRRHRPITISSRSITGRRASTPGLDVTSRDHASPLLRARRPWPCASKKNRQRCRSATLSGPGALGDPAAQPLRVDGRWPFPSSVDHGDERSVHPPPGQAFDAGTGRDQRGPETKPPLQSAAIPPDTIRMRSASLLSPALATTGR